jgi:hypothetical protein
MLLMALMFAASVAGCDEKRMSDGALTQTCRPRTAATGEERRESHPVTPTACRFGVLLMCNACVYDAEGGLSHSAADICGVCVGGSFQ